MPVLKGDILTIAQAADRLGISIDGVRKRILRNQLTHFKQGGRVMVELPPEIIDAQGLVPADVADLESIARGLEIVLQRMDQQGEVIRRQAEMIGALRSQNTELRAEVQALRLTVVSLAKHQAGAEEGSDG